MKVGEGVDRCLEYHRVNSKQSTLDGYGFVLKKSSAIYDGREVE
jgi:hypothetical protein